MQSDFETGEQEIRRISEYIISIARNHSSIEPEKDMRAYIVVGESIAQITAWSKQYNIDENKIVFVHQHNATLANAIGYRSIDTQLILLPLWYTRIQWNTFMFWHIGWYMKNGKR